MSLRRQIVSVVLAFGAGCARAGLKKMVRSLIQAGVRRAVRAQDCRWRSVMTATAMIFTRSPSTSSGLTSTLWSMVRVRR